MAKKTNHNKRKKWLLALVSVLVVTVIAVLLLYHANHKKVAIIPSAKISNKAAAKMPASTSANTNSSSTDSAPVKDIAPSSSGGQASSNDFLAPSGNFVSNHRPSLNSTTSPSGEVSTCNTSPGAQCYIEFDQGNQVKKLDIQTADSTGSVNWEWDVAKAGFTQGTWQVKAVATLNGQTKTTADSFAFEVQP